jgi:hypothetical protein
MSRTMSAPEEVESLAADRTMGAAETADHAARVLAALPPGDLIDAVEVLLAGHPSMAPLWRLAHVMLTTEQPADAAEAFRRQMAGDSTAAFALSPVLPGRILTISSSQAVADVLAIRKPGAVVCMASQPGGEGLAMAGMVSAYSDVRVIDDETAIAELPGEAVLIGADAITPTSVVNKVKSLELVRAAAEAEVPRYAVAGSAKLVPCELPVPELFQAVPLELFTAVALPAGLLPPADVATKAAAVPMHPALLALAERL